MQDECKQMYDLPALYVHDDHDQPAQATCQSLGLLGSVLDYHHYILQVCQQILSNTDSTAACSTGHAVQLAPQPAVTVASALEHAVSTTCLT